MSCVEQWGQFPPNVYPADGLDNGYSRRLCIRVGTSGNRGAAYGYNAEDHDTRYDIIYLMHGWGGSAGEYFNIGTIKETFDNLIENGDMKPVILVSATFYNHNSNRDFSGSIAELRAFHFYTEEEINADADKRDTGLFFFRGDENAPFAVCNAGGGFMYVGAMHDSFPHALELSKMGYNAFALIYRPDSAYEDLGRALAFIHDHADELSVNPDGYSLNPGLNFPNRCINIFKIF